MAGGRDGIGEVMHSPPRKPRPGAWADVAKHDQRYVIGVLRSQAMYDYKTAKACPTKAAAVSWRMAARACLAAIAELKRAAKSSRSPLTTCGN